MSGEERIVIVGGGPAAQAAAGAYREAGGKGRVMILAREPDPPYERPPLTKEFLRGESGREALPPPDARWYKDRRIDLRSGAEVAEIDLGKTDAWTLNGEAIGFDRLLLATGADPTVPPVPGADIAAVQTVRRIRDSERLAELAGRLEGLGVEILPEAELGSIRRAGDRSARARFVDGDALIEERAPWS